MLRRTVILLGSVLAVVALMATSCAPAAPTAQPTSPGGAPSYNYKWRMTTAIGSETDLAKACVVLADKIKDRTDGRVDVTVYADAALGAWDLTNEMIQRGDIEMMAEALDDSWDPRIAIGYYMPFLYIDYAQQAKLCAPGGVVYRLLNEVTGGLNYRVLGYFSSGVGGTSLTDVPNAPFDPDVPKGMKTRVMALTACRLTYERLGYMVAAIPFGEVYSAISTGIVQGQQGGGTMQAWMFRDVNSVWIHYKDYIEPNWWSINEKAWQSLHPTDQKIILDTVQEQQQIQLEYVAQMDENYMTMLKDYGWTILIPTDPEWEKMAAAVRKDVWPELVPLISAEFLDEVCDDLGIPRVT
jgi:TRAP-type C4-dicarboxylate transport system substrate-binding protein